jgi:hypothetical protein
MATRWDAIGPPLRPAAADVELLEQLMAGGADPAPRCVVLGATRELAAATWPPGTELVAVDRSPAMAGALWDRDAGPVVLGDWRALPLAASSADLVVCDGGWHLLGGPAAQERVVDELALVVRPGGAVAVRAFLPAPEAIDVHGVFDRLDAGAVADANHLKVLLWMATRDGDDVVAVHDVWAVLAEAHPDLAALAERLGWPPATLLAFEAYRDAPDRYHLVDEATLVGQFRRHGAFELDAVHEGAILNPGLRFPTLVLRRCP